MKIINWISLVALLLASLVGCASTDKSQAVQSAENGAIRTENMDLTVAPGEDFYQYANGGWVANHPIPAAFGRYSVWTEVWLRSNVQVKSVVTDTAMLAAPQGSLERKLADFYRSGMDTLAIDRQGGELLAAGFDSVQALQSLQDLPQVIAYIHRTTAYPLFNLRIDQDEKHSSQMIANLTQGGLGMPDRDLYLKDDARSQELRTAYKRFIEQVLRLLGDEPAEIQAEQQAIMVIETALADNSWTRVARRDPEKGYNPSDLTSFDQQVPGFDFQQYFTSIGIPDPGRINIRQPSYFTALSGLLTQFDLSEWQSYLKWNIIRGKLGALPQAFRDASFDFYGRAVNGTETQQPRWRQVLGALNGSLGEAVGRIYVARFFPPSSKARMIELVNNLRAAYAERIQAASWMTPATKLKAVEKLDAIHVKIGYPDKWTDFSSLAISADDYGHNLAAARAFHFNQEIAKLEKPVDRDEWFMNPQTVNAYYNPSLNEIVFPAGILQPPFFFPEGDEAVNYGGIGCVIGHEITHGFDDQGRKFDAEGNMKDWWTPTDAQRFDDRAHQVEQQYDGYFVNDSVHVNGALTLGENIADLGGVTIAYAALQRALSKHPQPEKIAGFDQSQRFFLAYAHVWCGSERPAAIMQQVQTNPHSPLRFRVIGPLVNTQAWYTAFGVSATDALFKPVAQRVSIW